jgi:hypothetical protein
MSLLSRLFGGGASKPEVNVETHKGFAIIPTPIKEGGRFRVSARIEKEVGGTSRVHTLIRADVLDSHDEAVRISLAKARQMIDEQGERLFG